MPEIFKHLAAVVATRLSSSLCNKKLQILLYYTSSESTVLYYHWSLQSYTRLWHHLSKLKLSSKNSASSKSSLNYLSPHILYISFSASYSWLNHSLTFKSIIVIEVQVCSVGLCLETFEQNKEHYCFFWKMWVLFQSQLLLNYELEDPIYQ